MTTLLIRTENHPLTVNLLAIAPMTHEQFYEFCLANRDLRIERTTSGDVVIMSPAFSDTGNRNFNLAAQLWNWTEQDGTGIGFDSSAGLIATLVAESVCKTPLPKNHTDNQQCQTALLPC